MSVNWGDIADEDEEVRQETEPNELGIKTIVEYRTNEQKQRVKVTKKIKVYKNVRKINRRAEERRKHWVKFGKCEGVDGIEPGVTGICEEVSLILGDEERKAKQKIAEEKRDEDEMKRMYASLMAQRPGGPAVPAGTQPPAAVWRPRFDRIQGPPKPAASATTSGRPAPTPGTYVPPRLRPGAGGLPPIGNEDDASTIRVTNLSEDTTEEELKGLFRPFGEISRTFLAKDKITQSSKGFAFINFKYRENAQAAMEALHGKGWDYLILNIEWAKPSTH